MLNDIGLSLFNKFIIAWVFFLFTLIAYNSLIVFIGGVDSTTDFLNTMQTFSYVIKISPRVIYPVKDFLTCISFIYLFWFQGTKVASASLKLKNKKQRGSINNNSIKDDINSEENKLGTLYLRGNYTLLTHTEILKGTENNYINYTAEVPSEPSIEIDEVSSNSRSISSLYDTSEDSQFRSFLLGQLIVNFE